MLKWKDGSEMWLQLKDVKESFPVQVAEYAVTSRIQDEPAFAWWVPHVLKKRRAIVAKVKSKYWDRTHKYGIRIPKDVAEARRIDKENGNTLWWDAIQEEMKNVMIAFEEAEEVPIGYSPLTTHLVFDVKLCENF